MVHGVVAHEKRIEVEQFKVINQAVEQLLDVVEFFGLLPCERALFKIVKVNAVGGVVQDVAEFVVIALVKRLRVGEVGLDRKQKTHECDEYCTTKNKASMNRFFMSHIILLRG